MAYLFNNFIFEPLLSFLVWIYNTLSLGDLGFAIIILTIIIRLVLAPFFYKTSKDQALVRKIQPQVDKIKKEHKNNKEKQAQELMALYKEHNLNPFSGFLLLLIQLPIFFALFKIFKDPDLIIETFNHITLFGVINLTEVSIVLVIVAAAFQYVQAKLSLKTSKNQQKGDNNPMAKFGNYMVYAGPVLSFVILTQLPSALALYWITSTLFSAGQQFIINKKVGEVDIETKTKPKEEKDGGDN